MLHFFRKERKEPNTLRNKSNGEILESMVAEEIYKFLNKNSLILK